MINDRNYMSPLCKARTPWVNREDADKLARVGTMMPQYIARSPVICQQAVDGCLTLAGRHRKVFVDGCLTKRGIRGVRNMKTSG